MNIYGIHLDFPIIRKAFLRKNGKNIEIVSLSSENEGSLSIFANLKGKIVTGLSAKDFLIKAVQIKVLKHAEEAIRFQTSATSHFKPDEVISIPIFNKKDEAHIFTILKENLKNHLQFLEKIHIDPDIVSSIPTALCNFVTWKFPQLANALIIDLGSSEITLALLENKRLKKAHAISKGIQDLLAALLEDRKKILLKKEIEGAAKQIDLLLLKPHLNPNLSSLLNEIRLKLEKVFYSYTKGLNPPVIFTGKTDCFVHLKDFLMDASDEYPLTLEEEQFAVSIGLALEKAAKRPLQMLREEFFPKKNWRRMGAYAISLIVISLILSFAMIYFGAQSSLLRKKQMLGSLNITEGKIDEWIALIEKNNREYPYILQAPRMLSFLNWLSTHPLLTEMENDPIQIRQIRYQLVSLPGIDTPNEKFLAKVDLEFLFKSVMSARRFHEALINEEHFVNSDLEITWETLDDGNRCCFYLKEMSYVP